jgi:hypothetical protein
MLICEMKDLLRRNLPIRYPVPRTDTGLTDDGLKSSYQLHLSRYLKWLRYGSCLRPPEMAGPPFRHCMRYG